MKVRAAVRGFLSKMFEWTGTPYIVVVLVCVGLLLPLYWTVVTSFKPSSEIFQWPPTFIPRHFILKQYVDALIGSPVASNILNSILYSLVVTVFVVTIGSLTTYGFAMYPYKGSNRVVFSFLAIRIIPPQILWLPFVIVYTHIGLINTRVGVAFF